jgi:hypothetical protein
LLSGNEFKNTNMKEYHIQQRRRISEFIAVDETYKSKQVMTTFGYYGVAIDLDIN